MRLAFWLACLLISPAMAWGQGVTVFAASSLKSALDPAAQAFEAHGGAHVVISYAASPALARQVDQGAPADLVLLAATDWMDYLQDRERIVSQTRRDLWGNGLSLIAHDPAAVPVALDGSQDLAAALGPEMLAMALVDSVPLGQYGKAALESLGQWDSVAPLVVQAQDARGTLALVASGQAGYGIVYSSDALALAALGQGGEVGRFPATLHPPIVFPAALVSGSANPEAALAFLAFLQGPEGQAVFAAQGYVILP